MLKKKNKYIISKELKESHIKIHKIFAKAIAKVRAKMNSTTTTTNP